MELIGSAPCPSRFKVRLQCFGHFFRPPFFQKFFPPDCPYFLIFSSANITVGINFLMLASKVLKNIAPETDIEVIEEHFRQKQEVSGTAKKIADTLDVPEDTIKSVRAGGIVGIHEILLLLAPYFVLSEDGEGHAEV